MFLARQRPRRPMADGRHGHLRRDDNQRGEHQRSHIRDQGNRQRPPRPRSLPVRVQEAPDVRMLEIADHDERGTTQDDEDAYGAVEVLVLEAGRVGLHDQGDLRDDESEAEEGDPGPKPRQEGAVVRELAIHWRSRSRPRPQARHATPAWLRLAHGASEGGPPLSDGTRHALTDAAAPERSRWLRPDHDCPLGTAVVPWCPLLHAPDMPQTSPSSSELSGEL